MANHKTAQVGIRTVAEHAGVGVSSVSRVLADHPDVSPEMREKVMAAVVELGYQPNAFAQGLRTGLSSSVGFVVGDIANPLISEIALGAETALRDAGYSMLLTNSGTDVAMDAGNIRLLARRQIDGLLLSVLDETNEEVGEALDETDAPAVLIDRELAGRTDASAVLSDHEKGITDAVDHVAALGHRKIALIGGAPHTRPVRVRERAVRAACRRYPDMSCTVRSRAYSGEHGFKTMSDLLDSEEPPTAVIVGGNQILPGVLEVLSARNLKLPGDISLITCDDVSLSRFLEPPIATLARAPSALGRTAAELLLHRLQGGEPSTHTFPVEFRPTNSCGPPPKRR